jgi:hypothetical protein
VRTGYAYVNAGAFVFTDPFYGQGDVDATRSVAISSSDGWQTKSQLYCFTVPFDFDTVFVQPAGLDSALASASLSSDPSQDACTLAPGVQQVAVAIIDPSNNGRVAHDFMIEFLGH